MASVAASIELIEDILRLRRAERVPAAAPDVAPVRRGLESTLGPTLSRARAARALGLSQTALDRWVDAGQVPTVVTPTGRREVPRQFVIELRESIEELRSAGTSGRPFSAALAARRAAADALGGDRAGGEEARGVQPAEGHLTAERRGLAYHALLAERLDEAALEEARERVEQLSTEGHLHPRYAKRWRELLASSPEEVAAALTADSQEGRDLRQNSPFAGVLNEQERRQIIETTG